MRALVLDQPGSFDALHLAEIPTPEPAAGEVRVRVRAVGLNPADYKLLLGGGHPQWEWPHVLGLDVAGIVDAVGEGVSTWRPGDRVFYHGDLARRGGLADFTLAPAHIMARIPDGLSDVDAAALPCAGLTAYQAIFRKLHLTDEDSILVQAGAGGVGGFAIQLARHIGATVLTTCSAENVAYVQGLGADYAIDYRDEDVASRVRGLTHGRGVDAVIDVLGREAATAGLAMLAFGGHLVCVEALPDLSRWRMFDRGISVHEIALGGAHGSGDRRAQEELADMAAALAALVGEGRVSSNVSEVVGLEGVSEALQRLAERHVRGKIVAAVAADASVA